MSLRVPDRFRRVREPNGTILTTFGLPAGPAGPGSENFFGWGAEKQIFPQFFCSQSIFIGS